MLLAVSGYEAFRCLMTKGEKCTLKASKQFGVNDAISKGEEWKMQCKRMHGDRGRYLVNVGEKCNLMIPWTKVQNFFHCSYGSNHTQAIVLQFFLQLVSRAFKMSIEMSSKQAKQFLTFQIGINFIFLQIILLALVVLSSITKKGEIVAKMASHAIFQYNVLVIDIDNTTLGLI